MRMQLWHPESDNHLMRQLLLPGAFVYKCGQLCVDKHTCRSDSLKEYTVYVCRLCATEVLVSTRCESSYRGKRFMQHRRVCAVRKTPSPLAPLTAVALNQITLPSIWTECGGPPPPPPQLPLPVCKKTRGRATRELRMLRRIRRERAILHKWVDAHCVD